MGEYTSASTSIHSNNFVFLPSFQSVVWGSRFDIISNVCVCVPLSSLLLLFCFPFSDLISQMLYHGGWLNTLKCWHIQWFYEYEIGNKTKTHTQTNELSWEEVEKHTLYLYSLCDWVWRKRERWRRIVHHLT